MQGWILRNRGGIVQLSLLMICGLGGSSRAAWRALAVDLEHADAVVVLVHPPRAVVKVAPY